MANATRRFAARWLFIAAASLVATQGAHAQAARPRSIVVRVVDSAGVPMTAVDLSIVRGLNAVVASGATDQSGHRVMTVTAGDGALQLVARKIGYQRGERFFTPARDTTTIEMALQRNVQSLDAVKVSADQDVKRKSYSIDADAIANSPRPLFDAMDVVTKLRPDMLYSRAGGTFKGCTIEELWINGRHISFSPHDSLDPMILSRRKAMHPPRGADLPGLALLKTLSMVKPEHIAEINYHDCLDYSLGRPGDHNAAFIVLKPGVGFDYSRGSYVIDQSAPSLEYRNRLLGLFDETSGEPVPDADVIDVGTATKAMTTSTGTVTLAFLPDGKSRLKIRKAGYLDLEVDVSISPKDTLPLTLVLSRVK